jgi:hypothetical protein
MIKSSFIAYKLSSLKCELIAYIRVNEMNTLFNDLNKL